MRRRAFIRGVAIAVAFGGSARGQAAPRRIGLLNGVAADDPLAAALLSREMNWRREVFIRSPRRRGRRWSAAG